MDYTTLAAVKEYGTINRAVKDSLIQNTLIPTASRRVDEHCRQSFSLQTLTQTIARKSLVGLDGFLRVWVNSPVVATLTALEYRNLEVDTAWQVGSLTRMDIEDRNHGAVVRLYANLLPYARGQGLQVRLTGTLGYANLAALPLTLNLACVRLVHWFLSQPDAPYGKAGNRMTGEWEVPAGLPEDVRDMLAPWRRPTP